MDQVDVRGNRDHDAKIVEVAISLHDRGKWIADLDIIKASKEWADITYRNRNCNHNENAKLDASQIMSLVSVDTWMELLDQPLVNCIVRAKGNAMARLAAASLASQKLYSYRIVSTSTCWACVAASTNPAPPTIVSRVSNNDQYDSDSMEESDVEEWGEGENSLPHSPKIEEEGIHKPISFLARHEESSKRFVFIC